MHSPEVQEFMKGHEHLTSALYETIPMVLGEFIGEKKT